MLIRGQKQFKGVVDGKFLVDWDPRFTYTTAFVWYKLINLIFLHHKLAVEYFDVLNCWNSFKQTFPLFLCKEEGVFRHCFSNFFIIHTVLQCILIKQKYFLFIFLYIYIYIISSVMNTFWLVLIYDLLEDRHIDDVIIKTFLKFFYYIK